MSVIEWGMLGAFVVALGLSSWKMVAFLPSKPLADDDTTTESVELLEKILIETDRETPSLDDESLYRAMMRHPLFDSKHFWRFNENRLHQLIEGYRFKDPNFRHAN